MPKITVTGYYAEYREGTSSKFYTSLVADNGVVVTNWGRIGSEGQSKIQKLPTREDAEAIAMRQFFSKKAKGYTALTEDLIFAVEDESLNRACESNDSRYLTRAFGQARTSPQFENDKRAVSAHYEDFVARAQKLMTDAADQPFETVWAQFQELKAAWEEIDSQHAQAKITLDVTTAKLNARLMSGAL